MGQRFQTGDEGYGLVIKLLIFTGLLWIGFEGYQSWQLRKEAQAQALKNQARQVDRSAPSAREPVNTAPYIGQTLPQAPQPSAHGGKVYRCGNSYSNTPCADAQAVDLASPVSYGSNSARKEIYLCKDYSGNLAWESVPCSANGRFMERIASVPANASWDQQVAIARAQRDKAQAIAAEQIVPVAPRPSMNARSSECQSLEWLIRRLDERCRASSCGMRELDEVREQRKNARDRQFRINC